MPSAATGDLLGKGHLAMTIDAGGDMNRYQGVVPLEGNGLEEAAHQYFRQSEQIPTRSGSRSPRPSAEWFGRLPAWRAGGLLVQFLPAAGERVRTKTSHPGDAPEDLIVPPADDDDAWTEAQALVETIEDHELIDPTIASEQLLFRLFHERGVRVFNGQGVRESCRCSQERILGMLKSFSDEERRDMVGDDGAITVTCEFCSRKYTLSPFDVGIADS